jgi:hypothetical protein
MILSLGGATMATLLLVGVAVAAGPHSGSAGDQVRDRDRDAIPAILGLTQAQIQEQRQDGLSLAQIAERQNVDPQKLVDALQARWTERITWRLDNDAITAARAAELRAQVETQARNMVYKTTLGGMQGAAVGAGPQAGTMNGTGNGQGAGAGNGSPGAGPGARGSGDGICDGSGRN